jgi:hypothetical protein
VFSGLGTYTVFTLYAPVHGLPVSLIVGTNKYKGNGYMGIVIGIVGILTWIILSVAVGTFAIVITIKDRIIKRQAAISLMLAFYGIPSLIMLFTKTESTINSDSGFLGLGFGMIILMLFIQVLLGYVIGEIIFKRKILRPMKDYE